MKTSPEIKPTDSITGNQKKYLDNLFYKAIENNPLADRLRRCPGCGLYHFVTHRSSDYHDSQCADDHQNLKKSQQAHALKVEQNEGGNKTTVNKSEDINSHKEELTPLVPMQQKEAEGKNKLKNEEILKHIIGGREEVTIAPHELFSAGFDENAYDARVKFPGSELNFCVYGEYCISWQDVDILIINLLKHMLWAHT